MLSPRSNFVYIATTHSKSTITHPESCYDKLLVQTLTTTHLNSYNNLPRAPNEKNQTGKHFKTFLCSSNTNGKIKSQEKVRRSHRGGGKSGKAPFFFSRGLTLRNKIAYFPHCMSFFTKKGHATTERKNALLEFEV